MSKTVAEYKTLLESCDSRIKDAEIRLEQARTEEEKHREIFSNQETALNSARFAEHRNKANNAWLFSLLGGIALVIASIIDAVYHMKIEEKFVDAFFYNLESPVLIAAGIIALVTGIVLFILRRKKHSSLGADTAGKTARYNEVLSEQERLSKAAESIKNEIESIKTEKKTTLDQMYSEHPEELEKVNAAKKAERDAALKKIAEEEAITLKAAEEAKLKAERLIEGNKMFEHPQAYVLDGQFENEYQVFMKAAEYGCAEAQEKVVCYLLGITYKNGVKQDLAAGEALALSFAKEGNGNMYEVLGKGYLYGEGSMPKDEEKGLKYLEKAASKGRQNAMLMAGVCHYNGVGCEPDEEEAKKYFTKAVKQGNAQAMQVLSAMENGQKLKF